MSDQLTVERGHAEEVLDMDKAREVGDTLNRHYPGYLWAVAAQGGVLVVKILGMNMLTKQLEGAPSDPQKWQHFGFVIKHQNAFSASDLAKQAVMAGGELLERAGRPRGRWDGEFAIGR